jgi:uncharacterized protein (TIGR03437 family)
MRIFFCFALLSLPLAAQSSLRYQDLGTSGRSCCVTTDSAGNVYAVNTYIFASPQTPGEIVLLKTDPLNNLIYTFTFDSLGNPAAIAVDSQQNVFITGSLVVQNESTGFVAKINPKGTDFVFYQLLGGTTSGTRTVLNAVATDNAGNVYVAGSTSSLNYPVSANAYQTAGPPAYTMGYASYAVLTELSADGSRILYSTFIGGSSTSCSGGSACIDVYGGSAATSVAIGSGGSIVIAGQTTATNFPVSTGVFQTSCGCSYQAPTGFVTSFSAAGALNWSTYLGGSGGGLPYQFTTSMGIAALAVVADGSVVVAGTTVLSDFPVTPNAFQTTALSTQIPFADNLFVSRLNSTGTSLLYSTFLGGSFTQALSGLALDAQGNIWVGGSTASSDFPVLPGSLSLGDTFVVEFDPTLAKLLGSQLLPNGIGDRAFTFSPASEEILLGSTGSLLTLPGSGASGTTVFGITNSAAYTVSGVVAPGELVTIYGIGLDPNPPAVASLDSTGRIAPGIGGTQVLFGGTAAPLLYAGPNQINAIVPFGVAGDVSTPIQIVTASGGRETFPISIASAAPELISQYNLGSPAVIALNQDQTINSTSNPARAGSIVTLYAFGAGALSPPLEDGAIAGSVLSTAVNPVTILFDGKAATILYAGSAPSLVAGVMQINLQLPPTIISAAYNTVQIQVSGRSGKLLTISVSQ